MVLTLLAPIATTTKACENPVIEVLPFAVVHDYSKSYSELKAMGIANEVGLVRTTSTVIVNDCKATVGYKESTLYVASELKRDQCSFDHVLKHEEEHVRIYEQHLINMKARIESRLPKQSLFEAAKTEVLSVQTEHTKHDSPEEYALNKTACNGRITRLALNR